MKRLGPWIPAAGLIAAMSLCGLGVQAGDLVEKPFYIVYPEAYRSLADESLSTLRGALDEVAPVLPPGSEPILVAICSTYGEFARYAGGFARSNVLGVALPQEGIIAVKAPNLAPAGADYQGTLQHELIHVLLARNSGPDNLPRWLNEGIAMALSGEHRWAASLRVGQMYVQGRLISYRDLFFVFLEPGKEMEFGDAYAQALSMTRHLMDRLGEDGFWRVVKATQTQAFGDALRAESSLSPMDFYDAWISSLWKVALIFSLVSGFSVFQIMAILTVLAYLRKRRQGAATVREWEEAESNDDSHSDELWEPSPWDEEEARLNWEEDED